MEWTPGSYCATARFFCSTWYPTASAWLVHERWRTSTVQELVEDPEGIAGSLANAGRDVFVRPDSPLKPFSGRVCNLRRLSLKVLDFGLYYEDPRTPVIVAPVPQIGQEWRFVVVKGRIVAGSKYAASTRTALTGVSAAALRLASLVAADLPVPEDVYVLDVCETLGGLRLLEINPFSGADMYGCDAEAIVEAVACLAFAQT